MVNLWLQHYFSINMYFKSTCDLPTGGATSLHPQVENYRYRTTKKQQKLGIWDWLIVSALSPTENAYDTQKKKKSQHSVFQQALNTLHTTTL